MSFHRLRATPPACLAAALLIFLIPACSSDSGTADDPGGGFITDAGELTADHGTADLAGTIPASIRQLVADSLNIFYGHTSHGSQIVTGLGLVEDEDASFVPPSIHEVSSDLGHNGDTSWAPTTRQWLNNHPECNVVMWSWCGGCSDNTGAGIATYLAAMESLEAAYPDVVFIYMTGHLDGGGTGGNLYARNNQIREYCGEHEKVLFDFADIESYSPDGTYYPDGSDACEWCSQWCVGHSCEECSCAHSHCFNCYRKGLAFWWLMAKLVGWEG